MPDTNSYNQIMTQRISQPGRAKRQLFQETEGDEGLTDNSTNRVRESLERELKEKSKKWHYDFFEDHPLPGKGNVIWKENENGEWIGEIQNNDDMENEIVETEEDIRMQNEVTPNPSPVKCDAPPPVRKRSTEVPVDPSSAKRKL